MKFSEKIIQARKTKALTQEDLADAVGVSRQAVSKWETEEAKPDLDKLVAICKVLDLSMDYLCLDKCSETVEAAPSPAQKQNHHTRRLILAACIGLVIGMILGMAGMGLYDTLVQPELPSASTVPTGPEALIRSMKISDADFAHVGATETKMMVSMTFSPSVEIPNMDVLVAVYDNRMGTTEYLAVENFGTGYSLEYSAEENCDLSFYVVFTYGDVSEDVPLFVYTRKDGTWMLVNSWEQ